MTFEFEKEEEKKASVTLRYTLVFTKKIPREAYGIEYTDEMIEKYELERTQESPGETIEWGLLDSEPDELKVEVV